jgi:hypothetical protein
MRATDDQRARKTQTGGVGGGVGGGVDRGGQRDGLPGTKEGGAGCGGPVGYATSTANKKADG